MVRRQAELKSSKASVPNAAQQPTVASVGFQPVVAPPSVGVAGNQSFNSGSTASVSIQGRLASLRKQREDDAKRAQAAKEAAAHEDQNVVIGIDLSKLQSLWKQYADALPQNEGYVRSIMERPFRVEGDAIVIDIVNQMQASVATNAYLLAFLRRELSNPKVVIVTNLVKVEENDPKVQPFTQRQKLEAMVEDNSEFRSFIDAFGLAFD